VAEAAVAKGPAMAVLRVAALTATAMLAFAANSLLCRLALAGGRIDPASFTSLRVVSGAVALSLIFVVQRRRPPVFAANWRSVLALTGYLVFFGFAYLSLKAGAGALILFGAVQLTMFAAALRAGERLSAAAWLGFVVALGGLFYLVSPGLAAPDPLGAALMTVAGIAWGAYSLFGRGTADPLAVTAANFIYATPLVLLAALFWLARLHLTAAGAALAVASGALASGCGYAIWYAALRGLAPTRAAMVQLSVPAIAALGAVVVLGEPLTLRLVLASALTLGGVGIALWSRASTPRHP
jgi:drug/metabolite transporter (DMT)-like permease